MTEKEFHEKRRIFYIDNQTERVMFPTAKHSNCSHSEWLIEIGYSYRNTTRGYILDNHVVLYTNDFEIPNVTGDFLAYIFSYFKNIEWIGLGCHQGNPGEVWEPKFKVFKCNPVLSYADTL